MNEIGKFFVNSLENTLIATAIYSFCLLTPNWIGRKLSQDLKSQKHLEEIMRKERKNLNINKKAKIYVFFNEEPESYAQKIGKNKYIIALSEKSRNDFVLRHELCHIVYGHCDDTYYSSFKYFLLQEPQATICSIFN